jgi:23S rRNA (cytosine1962-C5)-methyltransferase
MEVLKIRTKSNSLSYLCSKIRLFMRISATIFLKRDREAAVLRLHPWIFSGAIARTDGAPKDGDIVTVRSSKNEFLAIGHYQEGQSITVRIVSFKEMPIDLNFWTEKIRNAYTFRQKTGIIGANHTDCFRLIHAEGDGLPGLIIDIYGKTAVIQCHSIGMHYVKMELCTALLEVFGKDLEVVYDKSAETLPKNYARGITNTYLHGKLETQIVKENNHIFAINWETGQKTGFFLDQRDNRALLARYSAGKSVLNAFSYTGGFSMYALKAGAKTVHSVDVSAKAIDLVEQNVVLNQPFLGEHASYVQDVMQFLKDNQFAYDVMVIDPPAFAKSMDKRHNAVQGYKRLNALAIQQIASGGILFTFSCSQVVDRTLFYDTIVAAAIEAGRQVRVMHHLTQPSDHPVSLFHPEGAYLKGLVVYVE